MGTPPKNFNSLLESPYAKHLPQYPSQSEAYAPSEFGGKFHAPPSAPNKQSYQNHEYQPSTSHRRRGNNRYFNVNRNAGGYEQSPGGSRAGGGYRNNYHQSNYNQQTSRHSNSGNRQQPYQQQNFARHDNNDFFHPSMLEDPWKELLERHNAIKNSRISETTTETTSPSADNQYSSDEDITDHVASPKNATQSPSASPSNS